jgi:hypothetical protein
VYKGVICGIPRCALQFLGHSGRLIRATHRSGSCVFVSFNQLLPLLDITPARSVKATIASDEG